MLDKFNKLFNKIIFEQVQAEEDYDKYINDINTCDAFFRAYIEPLAEKSQVEPIKARYNVFRIFGQISKVMNFFKNFKVDKRFLEDSSKFILLNPMICLCENEHKYNKIDDKFLGGLGTEGETLNTYLEPSIETFNNQKSINKNIFGKWHDLQTYEEIQNDKSIDEIQKILTPKQTANKIEAFIKVINEQFLKNDNEIYIEFMVNVDKLPNNSFEELAKAIPIATDTATLSDIINNRADVVNPKPNEGVLGTVDSSKQLNKIVKETNKKRKSTKKK